MSGSRTCILYFSGALCLAGCGQDADRKEARTSAPKPSATSAAPAPAAPAPAAPAPAPAAAPTSAYDATLAEGIQFEKPGYPRFVRTVRGFSTHEARQRWTDGPVAAITFAEPLPRSFALRVEVVRAFGPNVGKPVTVKVGDWKGEMTVGDAPQTVELKVASSAPADTIEFVIPQPTSPRSLGQSADPRLLGFGFKRLSVAPL